MKQYIDKSALVAEIERMKVDAIQFPFEEYGTVGTCNKLLSFLNTVEVKEVDFDDFGFYWGEYVSNLGGDINNYEVAKYFYELGIKTQKEE